MVHIVPMLSPGGAERVAVHIVRGLNRQRYEAVVVSFTGRLESDLDHLLGDLGGAATRTFASPTRLTRRRG